MVRTRSQRLLSAACALAGLGLALAGPRSASAWTNTQPASVAAHVHVWPSGRALVRLSLELRVRGGWLSEFEIAGLDPGSVLDPDKPPFLLHQDGRKATPRAELKPDGVLSLSFARSDAPRRGRHRLGLAYFTQLSQREMPSGTRRLAFALPAWRVGLEHVDLWVNAPSPVRFLGREESALDAATSRAQLARGPRTVLHLHRAGLPRALPFGVELELPALTPTTAEREAAASGRHEGRLASAWLALPVLLLVWLKRRAVRARAARQGSVPVELVPMPRLARSLGTLACCAAGAFWYARSPALGLALLAAGVASSLYRHNGHRTGWPHMRGRFERAYDLLGHEAWLDATTPSGLALLGSAYALSALRIAGGGGLDVFVELLVLVTPLWLTGTRLHEARTSPDAPDARRQTGAVGGPTPNPRLKSTVGPGSSGLSPCAGEARRAPDRAA